MQGASPIRERTLAARTAPWNVPRLPKWSISSAQMYLATPSSPQFEKLPRERRPPGAGIRFPISPLTPRTSGCGCGVGGGFDVPSRCRPQASGLLELNRECGEWTDRGGA